MSNFIEQQHQDRGCEDEYIDNPNYKKKTIVSVLCSKIVKGTIIIILIAIVCPILAYYFAISRSVTNSDDDQNYSCLVQEEFRVACGSPNISETDCYNVMCCYNTTTRQCHHFIPSKYFYQTSDSVLYTTTIQTSPLGSKMINNIEFEAIETNTTLSLIIKQPESVQQQQQRSIPIKSTLKETKNNFQLVYSNTKLIFQVQDKDNDTIFNTANGAVIITDDYWEWTFQLSNDTILGLDRNMISLNSNETLTKVIYKNEKDHTTQPIIWAYNNNKFYTCLIRNTGPLELTVLASNIITLRSFTDEKIEIELTLGPTPEEIYQKEILNGYVPPVWALGTHNCRKGNDTNLKSLLSIYTTNNKSAFDTDCIHENLFISLQKSNTENDLNNFKLILDNLFNSSRFLLSLPPHIFVNESNTLYQDAKSLNILYNSTSGEIYQGQYLGVPVAYPDFSHPSIMDYIGKLFDWLETNIGLNYISGFVLNDNWPKDNSYETEFDTTAGSFSYFSKYLRAQINHTLPWNLTASNGNLHFMEHNSYGEIQTSLLIDYLNQTGKLNDFFIASASTILDDNEPEIYDNFESSWDNFKLYLDKMLFNSITGNSMIGFPICGDSVLFDKKLQEILCIRWYLAASTMPYFRVSSDNPYRDPANFDSLYGTNVVNEAMKRRKYFIDYFYTILRKNEPLLRPMYYNYFNDSTTFNLNNQYTIGKDILVAHPLSSGRSKLQVYLPPAKGNWYEFWSGNIYTPLKVNNYTVRIDLLPTDWISFIAQGHIVTLTNSTELNFYIALNCSTATNCNANGEIYKDGTLMGLSANDSCIIIQNLPADCAYTIGYIKSYEYDEVNSYANLYEIDYNLCEENNGGNVTFCFYNDDQTTEAITQ